MATCPRCSSEQTVKNGRIHNGEQNHRCRACGRQFILNPTKKVISDETKRRIDKLLVGEAAFSGHCPSGRCVRKLVAGVREPKVSRGRAASKGRAKKGALTIECDEAWSFVGNKENQQWIWLAQDRVTREIVGCYIGARDDEGAIGLWQSLPECYLDAETYVDFWQAYDAIFYAKTLHHVGKESGQTNHIERFNNTLRQRVSRLVRKTLSFSKKLDNHLGAIWTFVHHHNQSLLL